MFWTWIVFFIEKDTLPNFKTIAWLPAEISDIKEKQRMSYGFHINNFWKTNFCDLLYNAWAVQLWKFQVNPASRSRIISEKHWH